MSLKSKLSSFLFFVCFFTFSQSLEKDLQQVNEIIDTAKQISLNVKVAVYNGKNGKLTYKFNCIYERNNSNLYSKIDQIENLVLKNYYCQIDQEQKMFYVSKKSDSKMLNEYKKDIKDLIKKLDLDQKETDKKSSTTTKLIDDVNGVRTYRILGVKDVDEIIIQINHKLKSLKKISYLYSKQSDYKGQYIVIDYEKFVTNSSSFDFSLTNFFSEKSGNYTLLGKYKNYKLIAQ